VSRIERFRERIEQQYELHPTGCGGSFDEILCYELHSRPRGDGSRKGLTFNWLAEKWGIPVSMLGELIWDHCKGLEKLPSVNHRYTHG